MGKKLIVASESEVNKVLINEAITLLTQNYANPTRELVEKVMDALRKSAIIKRRASAIRADTFKLSAEDMAPFWPTEEVWFDDWLKGGIRKGEVLMWGATPHAGKSHLLTWCGGQFILQGRNIVHFFGEDLPADILENYRAMVGKHRKALQHLYLCDMQEAKFGIPQMEAVLEDLKGQGITVDGVVLDHIDLMSTSDSKADWEGIAQVSQDVKTFTKRNDVFLFTASQANFSLEQKGMARLYRSKVGKSANVDILIMVNDVIDQDYDVTLWKARGRKIFEHERQKTLYCDWDNMIIEEAT